MIVDDPNALNSQIMSILLPLLSTLNVSSRELVTFVKSVITDIPISQLEKQEKKLTEEQSLKLLQINLS